MEFERVGLGEDFGNRSVKQRFHKMQTHLRAGLVLP